MISEFAGFFRRKYVLFVLIYGGAWEEGLYLIYNDTQYEIKNSDKFYENLESVFVK